MSLVLDSSVTLARVFPDEWAAAVDQVFDGYVVLGARVPSIWKIELANVLSMSVRKRRITKARRDEILVDLQFLPIAIDPETGNYAWNETTTLAERHRLTLV